MELHSKIIVGLERISEVFKTLLWEKAKVNGISPIQIQIIIFVSNHRSDLCNVSHLAKEFNVTKPTISDAVRVLLKKELVEKDFSPVDNRRYDLLLTAKGQKLVKDLYDYTLPITKEFKNLDKEELNTLFKTLSKLIFQLNQKGIIQVQRTCFGCKFYQGDRQDSHFCNFLNKKLVTQKIRLDCAEFEEKAGS